MTTASKHLKMMRVVLLLALQSSFNHALAPSPASLFTKSPSRKAFLVKTATALPMITSGSVTGLTRTEHAGVRHCNEHVIMMVRGGGDIEDDTDDDDESEDSQSEEYDSDADEDEVESIDDLDAESTEESDDESIDIERAMKIEKLQKQAQLSQQSRNFAITTALWSSLFFDAILNKAKRCDLFPTLSAATTTVSATSNLMPTAFLSSGFAMASGAAFLLWRDLEIRAEMAASDEETDAESRKGDWFLSLSNAGKSDSNDSENEVFVAETRQRLYLHLSLFGLLSLTAHAGIYFSDKAPYLGMSAAIINVHNTLTCISALIKEKGFTLFQNGKGRTLEKEDAVSFLFRMSTIVAWVRCIPTCQALYVIVTGLLSGSSKAAGATTLVNNARELSLQISALARLMLAAGVSRSIYASSVNKTFRDHPFFSTLSGVVSAICLGVGGTMLFSMFMSKGEVLNKLLVGDGILLLLFGLVSGYKSLSGYLSYFKGKA